MPLDLTTLKDKLETLFADPPETDEKCAEAWAAAIGAYAAGIVPASTTVTAATTALKTALTGAFAKVNAIADFDAALEAFAAAVGVGMAPLYSPTPPTGPDIKAALIDDADEDNPKPIIAETHKAGAAAIAGHIDDWMKTGSAALVAPPNTPQNWS